MRETYSVRQLIAIGVVLFALAAFTRLVPTEYRPFNATAVGAVAMFAAARLGFGASMVITMVAMLASGAVLWWQHDFHTDYAPYASTYLGMLGYALLGRAMLCHNDNPLRVVSAAFGGSLFFFAVTNAFSWVSPLHNYERSLAGLVECYAAAVPFYRTTLVGDVLFSVALFGFAAALARVTQPAPALAFVPVERGVQS